MEVGEAYTDGMNALLLQLSDIGGIDTLQD